MFGNRGFSPYTSYGLGAAKSGINWSNLLSNTQKTLGIINQAIPAFYQVKPIFNNIKTMFRVVNELNKDDSNTKNKNSNINKLNNTTNNNYSNNYSNNSYDEGPNFFL